MPIFFTSCISNDKKGQNLLNTGNVSEYRTNLFFGKGKNFVATFTTGEREKNYIMDGEPSQLTDFGVITLALNFETTKPPQFEFKLGDNTFVGEFEKNPYDKTFVYDIATRCLDGQKLSLYVVDCDEKIDLNCVSKDWNCSLKTASNIFVGKFGEKIKLHTKDDKLEGEIYFKLVSDDMELTNVYWYVLLVCKNGDMYSCLIDTLTCEIVQNQN